MTKEFPPYPDNWVILNEHTVDEVFPADENTPEEHFLYRSVTFFVVDDSHISIGDATYWLEPDMGSWYGKEWRGSPDSGSYIPIEDFKKIVEHLPL